MSIYIDDVREIGQNHGWSVLELVADEIEDTEKACALLFSENGKLKDRIEQLERELSEVKIGHARYEYVRNMPTESFIDIKGNCEAFDKAIDAAINGVKA